MLATIQNHHHHPGNMTSWKMMILTVVLFSLLLHITQANFLHAGCSSKSRYEASTFANSLQDFYLLFPPRGPMMITVDQKGRESRIQVAGSDDSSLKQSWLKFTLHLREMLELSFSNGTTWIKEDSNRSMSLEPKKDIFINARAGYFMEDCPQDALNWALQSDTENLLMHLGAGDEVFSLFPTHPTMIVFTVGKVELVLCWNAESRTITVFPATSLKDSCHPLPPANTVWLQVNHLGSSVQISSPDDPQTLKTFYVDDQDSTLMFKSSGINGTIYVVHHLKGFPVPDVGVPEENGMMMCVNTAIPVVSVVVVLLVFSVSMCAVFYCRWSKASSVLLMLRTMENSNAEKDKNPKEQLSDRENNYYTSQQPLHRPPSPPSSPIPALTLESNYLTPRQLKGLSEHLYEKVEDVHTWSSENKTSSEHENPAFTETKNVGEGQRW